MISVVLFQGINNRNFKPFWIFQLSSSEFWIRGGDHQGFPGEGAGGQILKILLQELLIARNIARGT